MPTETSLRNLVLTPEQRAENVRKMQATRRRQIEAEWIRLARLYEPLEKEGMTIKAAAVVLCVGRSRLGAAVRFARENEKRVEEA